MIQWVLSIWYLVPLPFLNQVCTSGNFCFIYCWSRAWTILNTTLLACERVQLYQHLYTLWNDHWKSGKPSMTIQSYCWLYSLCYTLHPCDLFYNRKFVPLNCLYLIFPTPTSLTSGSYQLVFCHMLISYSLYWPQSLPARPFAPGSPTQKLWCICFPFQNFFLSMFPK